MVKRQMEDFTLLLSLSALSFFFFGYHVHEKALLLIVIPLTITAFSNPRYIGVWHLLSVITSFSLFPLLFTPFEVPLKYVIGAVFFLLCIISVHFAYKLNIWDLIPSVYLWYMIVLVIVEGYNTFVHKAVFGDRLQFFPLMSVSIYNAMGVLWVYKCLLQMALAEFLGHEGKKRQLQADEIRVLSNSHAIRQIKELRDVHIVAGVDISTHKTSQELAVVSLCIYSFPDLKLLGTFDEVTLIAEPYISDYLSLREAGPIVRLINRVIRKTPYLKPDVVFTDGNGRFHSRGCGLACHIAFGTNIPTVGVAKNLNLSSLHAVNAASDVIECANKVVEDVRNMDDSDDFYVTFDVIKPVVLNIGMRLSTTNLLRRMINSTYHDHQVVPKADRWQSRERLNRFTAWQYASERDTVKGAYRKQNKVFQYLDMQRRDEPKLERFHAEVRVKSALAEHNFEYKHFRNMLDMAHIKLDNVVLSQLSIYEPRTFHSLVTLTKEMASKDGRAVIPDEPDFATDIVFCDSLFREPLLRVVEFPRGAAEDHVKKPRKLKPEEY